MTGSAQNRSWHLQTFGCKIIGTQPTAHLQRCLCKGECENKMVSSSFFSFGIKILHSSSKTTYRYRIFFLWKYPVRVCTRAHECALRCIAVKLITCQGSEQTTRNWTDCPRLRRWDWGVFSIRQPRTSDVCGSRTVSVRSALTSSLC